MIMDWYEVWADHSTDAPYLLIVAPGTAGTYVVIDPKEGDKRIFVALSYEEVKLWLLEDEYTRVEGRMIG